MTMLVMGLYVEGPTDNRFLPVIIQRTAEHILLQCDRAEVTVLEPISIKNIQIFCIEMKVSFKLLAMPVVIIH